MAMLPNSVHVKHVNTQTISTSAGLTADAAHALIHAPTLKGVLNVPAERALHC
jgi:hypothetical protein